MSLKTICKQAVVGISLRLELNSEDGLRRVVFMLSREAMANERTRWKIGFELYERDKKSAAFVKLMDLDVDVTTKNEKNAEAVMNRKKLTIKQSAHAIGTAADLAKAAAADEVDFDTAKESVEETLAQ